MAQTYMFDRVHSIVWERFAAGSIAGYRAKGTTAKPENLAEKAAKDADALMQRWLERFSHEDNGQ